MFASLVRFFRTRFGKATSSSTNGTDESQNASDLAARQGTTEVAGEVVPFDETLLERCRIMWQSGNWEGIKELDVETVKHHPDRAKLALLSAAAHQQTGSIEESRTWLRLARDWGCSKQLMSQIMISGVYNTLARASFAAGRSDQAQLQFEEAMRCGAPKGNLTELTQARIASQIPHLQLTTEEK